MTRAVDQQRADRFLRVLGDELRQTRKSHGWTRRDLLARLDQDISLQTLASYELGTRQCTVVRLWELTEALERSAQEVWLRVLERIGACEISGLTIDLRVAAKTTMTKLGPLAAWARVRLRTTPEERLPVVTLDRAALELLADVCGTDIDDLVRRLQDRRAGLICSLS